MGPLLLIPVFVAAVAALVAAPESQKQSTTPPASKPLVEAAPQPLVEAKPLEDEERKEFVERYRCSLFNEISAVGALPKARGNKFLVLMADDQQKYTQIMIDTDNRTVLYEASSRFYEFKAPNKRLYWPQDVQAVIAGEGFNLELGKTDNYVQVVPTSRSGNLMDLAKSMLRISYDGFGARMGTLKYKIPQSLGAFLNHDVPCMVDVDASLASGLSVSQ